MASIGGVAAVSNLALICSSSSKRCSIFSTHLPITQPCATISTGGRQFSLPWIRRRKLHSFRGMNSVQMDVFITSDDEDEMGEGFFAAIEELERMAREPSDVLEEMNDKLSARELQLVLVYFAQEGRDSWCALEVFEWLKKENRVDKETMELMISIMCAWVKKLIEGKNKVEDVVDLLVDMDCVGLKAKFSMVEKVISLYWEAGERDQAVLFVTEVLRRGISVQDGDRDGSKGGPVGYLAWKMMEDGSYRDAAKLVITLRESGLDPEPYSYLIAMTAVVKELNEFAKALRRLKSSAAAAHGLAVSLDPESLPLVESHQRALLSDGLLLSNWAIQNGGPHLVGLAHERLLAMYICAGRGPEAERQLWELKLAGREAGGNLYGIVLAICASQGEAGPVGRLLARAEAAGPYGKRMMLTWLVRGYVKGGYFRRAAEVVIGMLDSGLCPEYVDQVAVVRGLSRRVQGRGDADAYLGLCKRLSDAGLVGPVIVYLHLRKKGLWVIKMV